MSAVLFFGETLRSSEVGLPSGSRRRERGECSAAQLISCSVIPSELDGSVSLLMLVKRHRSVLNVGVKLDLGGLGRR